MTRIARNSLISAALAAALAAVVTPSAVVAHHAAQAYFDVSTVVEVRGVITEVKWQNPHIGFTLISREDDSEVGWDIESNSISTLRQLGITEAQLEIGALVTVAGWPSRRADRSMSGNHVLFADGRELVLRGTGARYFSDGSDGRLSIADIESRELGDAAALGLFRIWSTITGDPDQNRLYSDEEGFPLTLAARAAQAAWDPVRDNPSINCKPKGMPGILDPPYPMEFVDQGDVIIQRQEEFDTVRTIYMNPQTAPNNPEPSILGHSLGHWEGDTLVIETTRVSWSLFDGQGVPQSDQARYVERYTVSENGKRLNFTMEVTDPVTFTAPVLLDRDWIWMSESRIEPYNCTPL